MADSRAYPRFYCPMVCPSESGASGASSAATQVGASFWRPTTPEKVGREWGNRPEKWDGSRVLARSTHVAPPHKFRSLPHWRPTSKTEVGPGVARDDLRTCRRYLAAPHSPHFFSHHPMPRWGGGVMRALGRREVSMTMIGRIYLDPGDRLSGRYDPPRLCEVITRWRPGCGKSGPHNVAVRYLDDGTTAVVPFMRRLRQPE
jgi:hypothetical protein